ncbi:MAG: pilus assembly protein PilM [Candidatus Omnitrophica bacterium]|nr:pilus assembly protein PilM [Candidatus Omnitrophota bacterium]MCF7887957.1 pilus assembly protein PilM [Candidatus Omnitrophota bacterium]
MTKKEKVGLYLGTSLVGLALKEGKNLLFLGSNDISSIEARETESLDENLHWQALIRKSLRQANIDSKVIDLSLADRDFIIRSLEMPLMGKKEIEASLIYEIEKYIPFKPEELVWDYQFNRIPKEKKVSVSFIGIRKSSLEQTKKILSNIELEAATIEPGCLSLARMLKSKKETKDVQNFVLLDLTSQEVYLTFFQNDLPVFNRYLNIKEKEGKLDLEHFVEAVNFSFQYFRREFKSGKLDKMFVVSDQSELDSLVDLLKKALLLDVRKVVPYELTSRQEASTENLKALGCASRNDYPYKFSPVLKEFEETKKAEASFSGGVDWRWGLIGSVAAVAVIACFLISLFFNNILSLAEDELKKKEKTLNLPEQLQQLGWQNIKIATDKKLNKIKQLKQLKEKSIKLSNFLSLFVDKGVIPDKMWLDLINVSRRLEEKYSVEIRGYIYRADDYQERLAVNDFVSNLRAEESVNSLFNIVEATSTDREKIRDFTVTKFVVNLY